MTYVLVRMFMELAMCAAMPVGGHTRESALQTLGECGGDVRIATLRLMSRPAAPSQQESRWTPDEVEAFLAGLGQFDKDFFRISQLVRDFLEGTVVVNKNVSNLTSSQYNNLFTGKIEGLKTVRSVLLLLEEGDKRLQDTVFKKLGRFSSSSKHPKHRAELYL